MSAAVTVPGPDDAAPSGPGAGGAAPSDPGLVPVSGGARRAGVNARALRRRAVLRAVVLSLAGVFFGLPFAALLEFSTRGVGSARSLDAWRQIAQVSDMTSAITASVELALVTAVAVLVLLTPTMVWVRLRLPWARRAVQFVCLLPLTIPVVALVVGLAPVYLWVNYLLGISPLTLAFCYVVFALPYAHSAIDTGLSALDLRTLSEAARGLGASWRLVIVRVIVPNLAPALVNAGTLTVALVLGEFTAASLLGFPTLPVELAVLGGQNSSLSIAVSAAAMVFSFALLLVMNVVTSRLTARRSSRRSS